MSVSASETEVATCFAVQLQESSEPIDTSNVPALPIFDSFALYETETMHEGHAHHALRLGFFIDATAAEHVMRYVRKHFAAALVVAVDEIEITQASEIDEALPEDLADADVTLASDSDEAEELEDLPQGRFLAWVNEKRINESEA